MLAGASARHTVHLWNIQHGEMVARLGGHRSSVHAVAFSPDGHTLASGSVDQTIRLWQMPTGTPCQILEGHRDTVLCLTFSPDGTTLLSGSSDEDIRQWDVESGDCLRTLRAQGPYAGMNITDATGLTAVQRTALLALGAVEDA